MSLCVILLFVDMRPFAGNLIPTCTCDNTRAHTRTHYSDVICAPKRARVRVCRKKHVLTTSVASVPHCPSMAGFNKKGRGKPVVLRSWGRR